MNIISKDKSANKVLAYTYMLEFNHNNETKYYYGVRYANIRLNIAPVDDIFTKYFTSSGYVKMLIKDGVLPSRIVIHKTFKNKIDACKYECRILTRLDAANRKDFLNQTNHFDNSLPSNSGRIMKKETKLKISKSSSINQNNDDYKEYRKNLMKSKWKDPEFKEKMNKRNVAYKESGKSKTAGKKSGASRIGMTYSDEVKTKRSIALKEACKNIDMRARALNRKRHTCPVCKLDNLDGSAFNGHMIARHTWSKEQCQSYKCTTN